MKIDDAKRILSFYRPGTADERDPAFAEALELARRAAGEGQGATAEWRELHGWFREHCAQYVALRARFRSVAPPPGLPEQILAERKIAPLPTRNRSLPAAAPWLALAAAVVLAACLLPLIFGRGHGAAEFTACRNQMVRLALTPYAMDLETTNADRVRAYLAERGAPGNYVVPPRLAESHLAGCAVRSWNNAPVSLICFRSGKPLRAGDNADLWLFVIDNSRVPGDPTLANPAFAAVSRAATASWTQGGQTYILVGSRDKEFLERYLD